MTQMMSEEDYFPADMETVVKEERAHNCHDTSMVEE